MSTEGIPYMLENTPEEFRRVRDLACPPVLYPLAEFTEDERWKLVEFEASEEPEEIRVAAILAPSFPVAAFWAKVQKTNSCWLWTGSQNQGYGVVMHLRRNYRAHRVSWLLAGRAIPDGLVLDHLCRIRCCVNPDHLEVVTNRENVLRGEGRSAVNAEKTHCDRGHALVGRNLVISTRGDGRTGRSCRECGNAKSRVKNARPKTCDCGVTVRSTNLRRHQQTPGCMAAIAALDPS